MQGFVFLCFLVIRKLPDFFLIVYNLAFLFQSRSRKSRDRLDFAMKQSDANLNWHCNNGGLRKLKKFEESGRKSPMREQ